ncbi:hypothetical protein TrLO_g14965 [Triparma laevis f. longispina]|uniref:Protein DPCD n=1 Tax=Triparma laevis f. longispina TaxID=1714387 RepID=A0A9W7EFH3_9STRA|nr:hypothetical protein TrLO_g14965 [Triparma laevis f. longispina]
MYRCDLPLGVTTALKVAGRLRVQTSYGKTGVERVEEWGADNTLLMRRWRSVDTLDNAQAWEFEIGDAAPNANNNTPMSMSVSSINPSFHPRNSSKHFLFHIINVPWPIDNYTVICDSDKNELILRTHNKKYFKRFKIPSLVRLQIPHDEQSLTLEHRGENNENLLIISYLKPPQILIVEESEKDVRIKAMKNAKDGDVDCKQS